MPKVLGVLLAVAGAGYLVDSFTAVLGSPTNVGAFTFVGEFLLAVWLLIRSRKFAEATMARSQPTSPVLPEPPREPAARAGARPATVAAPPSATR